MIGGSEVWPSGKRLVSFRDYGVERSGGRRQGEPGVVLQVQAQRRGRAGGHTQAEGGGRAVGRGQKHPSCDPR